MRWILLWLLPLSLLADEVMPQEEPRTLIGLWDSSLQRKLLKSPIPLGLELPLNYLGISIEYHDVQKPLPDLSRRNDVRGIILWLPDKYPFATADELYQWLLDNIDQGKKLLFMTSPNGFSKLLNNSYAPLLLSKLGILATNRWTPFTYNYELCGGSGEYYPFEATLPLNLPDFIGMSVDEDEVHPILNVQLKNGKGKTLPVIFTSKNGLFAYAAYLLNNYSINDNIKTKWTVNPFKLFREVLELHDIPVPDPTTLCGRRIYYSHIDGDGWNNVTLTKRDTSANPTLSSEVVMEKVIKPHPHLPVTVGPIAADINPAWFGNPEADQIAKRLFDLQQVEIGSHTYTHPFDWGFFRHYTANKEQPYLHLYPTKTFDDGTFSFLKAVIAKPSSYYSLQTTEELKKHGQISGDLEKGYTIPRAYALKPFDVTDEVLGAINEVNTWAPEDKKVEIYQWSGNGEAFEEALKLTVQAHVQNINGGNCRLDFSSPSYSAVSPIGINCEGYYQIFSSNSNENVYTNLWTDYFYGFASLPHTFQWTETPVRIKPMNLYYHMYSGERQRSLNAVLRNLRYIANAPVIPIHASHYTKIADGFYHTQLQKQDKGGWIIRNRGELQTLRLDHAVFQGADFVVSKGVIGQKHFQGSLYLFLDPAAAEVELVLKAIDDPSIEPTEPLSYLLESRWEISHLEWKDKGSLQFKARGFGPLEMSWVMSKERIYRITARDDKGNELLNSWIPSKDHVLTISLELPEQHAVEIEIVEEGEIP